MAEEVDPLFLHLHKIPPTTPEESLDQVLQDLWRTRKTGLGSSDKTRIHSLLPVPSLQELDLVLACLRLLIRKSVHEKLSGDDIRRLFPLDISGDLQSILVTLLLKYQNEWMEKASRDQPLWQRTRVSNQVKLHAPPTLSQFRPSELSALWPRQDSTSYPYCRNLANPVANYADPTIPLIVPASLNEDNRFSDNLAKVPQLKSMTWTMENHSSTSATRVAIITLKLQDYMNPSSREMEVKFQLSKDTMEAMLRSMTHISEQLSNSGLPTSEPSSKKKRS